jgi:hypothetical protein
LPLKGTLPFSGQPSFLRHAETAAATHGIDTRDILERFIIYPNRIEDSQID